MKERPRPPSAPTATGKGFPSVVVTSIAMTTALAPDAETTWKLRWGADRGVAAVKGSRASIEAAIEDVKIAMTV